MKMFFEIKYFGYHFKYLNIAIIFAHFYSRWGLTLFWETFAPLFLRLCCTRVTKKFEILWKPNPAKFLAQSISKKESSQKICLLFRMCSGWYHNDFVMIIKLPKFSDCRNFATFPPVLQQNEVDSQISILKCLYFCKEIKFHGSIEIKPKTFLYLELYSRYLRLTQTASLQCHDFNDKSLDQPASRYCNLGHCLLEAAMILTIHIIEHKASVFSCRKSHI